MLELHPLCTLFPPLDDDGLSTLREDIRAHGQQTPIVLLDGKILDGRNRYYACLDLDIEPITKQFVGDDPMAFVLSVNLHRRHLTEAQRAAVAAKLANMKLGDNKGAHRSQEGSANLPTLNSQVSQADAAKMLNVSTRSVTEAKRIERADPDLSDAVAKGGVSLSAASKVAGLPPEERKAVISGGSEAINEAARAIKPARFQGKPKTGPKADAMRAALKEAMGQDERATDLEPSAEDTDPLADAKPNKKIASLATDLAGRLNDGHFPVGEEHEALVQLHAALGALLGDEVEMQLDALTRECERLTQENQRLQAVAETDLGQKVIEAQTNLLAMRQRRDSLMQEIAVLKQENEQLKKARRAGHGS